ncbi:hypothetical protein Taro_027848, partial [Colocasia esculenta]|nr:hypothetical protein [Colocasia esculenta]
MLNRPRMPFSGSHRPEETRYRTLEMRPLNRTQFKVAQVEVDEKRKMMSFLWSFHNSPAAKNSSTQPHQVVKLVPR